MSHPLDAYQRSLDVRPPKNKSFGVIILITIVYCGYRFSSFVPFSNAISWGGRSAHSESSPEAIPKSVTKESKPFDALGLYPPEEIDILLKLSQRREKLDQQEEILRQKEISLKAMDQAIIEKIKRLKDIQDAIQLSLNKVDKEDAEAIQRLAKVYENMKPKEASRIFDELDLPLLSEILKYMSVKKISGILGLMRVAKAKEWVALTFSQRNKFSIKPEK